MQVSVSITFLLLLSYFPISYSSKHYYYYTSIISFGDSFSDTGNFLSSGAASFPMVGWPPYGMTYFGHPTGRLSDGRLVVDFIAQAFGLPLLPPFLGEKKDFKKGVNFAVAGATALDPSFFVDMGLGSELWTNYSLNTQLEWFKGLKPSLCHSYEDCSEYFKTSLFLVGEIGGNDYNYPLLSGRISLQEMTGYVPKVVESIANATQTLIDLGAVNIVVPGSIPSGCIPLYLTLLGSSNPTDYDSNGCIIELNNFSKYHHELLIQALQQLQLNNPHAKIVYANYYDSVYQMNYSPVEYGFSSHGILKTCCGGGGGPYNLNLSEFCGLPGSGVLGDPKSYLSWDGIHLTEAGYQYIAMDLLYGSYASQPISNMEDGGRGFFLSEYWADRYI